MAQILGIGPVQEALRSGKRQIERILIAQGAKHPRMSELVASAKSASVPMRREPKSTLDRMAGGANHQGVIAITAPVKYADAYDFIRRRSGDSFLVLLDGVEDPHNLGAIIRTAECAGALGVVVPERRAAHVTETAVKTSAGATEFLPTARVTNLASYIEDLKKEGFWIVGLYPESKTSYTDISYSGPTALVFGGEGQGLHRLVKDKCDYLVSIPMQGRIQSLNVSVSTGVVLFELVRQRTASK